MKFFENDLNEKAAKAAKEAVAEYMGYGCIYTPRNLSYSEELLWNEARKARGLQVEEIVSNAIVIFFKMFDPDLELIRGEKGKE